MTSPAKSGEDFRLHFKTGPVRKTGPGRAMISPSPGSKKSKDFQPLF
jgi:hypothetical protein